MSDAEQGARYDGAQTPTSPGVDDSPDRECRHCGAPVSARFARVFGDNHNRVHRCVECAGAQADIKRAAAGLERPHMMHAEDRPDGGGAV